jgi:hypothetical protein
MEMNTTMRHDNSTSVTWKLFAIATILMIGGRLHGQIDKHGTKTTSESVQTKIQRALSAGPPNITRNATVADMGSHGEIIVLRKGTNDFTCFAGSATGVGMPAMCEDKVAMQWNKDRAEGKPRPTTTVPGVEYMLAGATQRSDSDPFDKTDPPIKIGPHWMILWPFDPKTTGLPTTHKPTGTYIMYAGTPWAHLHIMGTP